MNAAVAAGRKPAVAVIASGGQQIARRRPSRAVTDRRANGAAGNGSFEGHEHHAEQGHVMTAAVTAMTIRARK